MKNKLTDSYGKVKMLGVQDYDDEGKPICPICEKSFHRLIAHTRQSHGINQKDYVLRYGFCSGTSFLSKESKQKARLKVLNNPQIIEALTKNGQKTRFKIGHHDNKGKMTPERKIKIALNRAKADTSNFMKKIWLAYKKEQKT